MRRTILRYVTVPAFIVALPLVATVVFLWVSHRAQVATQDADVATINDLVGRSGPDFELEGRPVHSCVSVKPDSGAPGDALIVLLQLESFPSSAGASPAPAQASLPCELPPGPPDLNQLGNLQDGILTPDLFVPSDCSVAPAKSRGVRTNQDLNDFVWLWIVDCKTDGNKGLEANLVFVPNAGKPDTAPLDLHQLIYVDISTSIWQQLVEFFASLGSVIVVISGGVALLTSAKAKPPEDG